MPSLPPDGPGVIRDETGAQTLLGYVVDIRDTDGTARCWLETGPQHGNRHGGLHGGIMAYFNWSAKNFASLIFPKGSELPEEFELLHGDGLQRMARFTTVDEVEAARDELLDIVDLWCMTR